MTAKRFLATLFGSAISFGIIWGVLVQTQAQAAGRWHPGPSVIVASSQTADGVAGIDDPWH